MPINISPNMSLPIPSVGQEAGPQYATDVNNSLTIIDGHTHSPGAGVQITPAGMDINSDLTINSNNLTLVRSLRFDPQVSPIGNPTDLGCLYEAGVDLYYNDGAGNQIRMTSGGSIVGSSGNITGLVPPASASYSSGTSTFIWQSDVNTPANMDAASYIFRNLTMNSFGITVSAPAALGSNYTIVLPTLPATPKIMRIDNAGNISSTLDVDNVTIDINSNNLEVKPGSITTTQIATNANILGTQLDPSANILGTQLDPSANILGTQLDPAANVLRTQFQATNIVFSSNSGTYTQSSGSGVFVPNLSVTITNTKNPIVIGLTSNPGSTNSYVAGSGNNTAGTFRIIRDNVNNVASFVLAGTAAGDSIYIPSGGFVTIDPQTPGTYNYKLQGVAGGGVIVSLGDVILYAYEMV